MKIVYHYCSLDSFLQIITHKTIRLSSMRHMNDPNELKWGFNKYLLTYDLTDEEKKEYEDKFQELSYNIHMACFSEQKDLLSQWRAYGDQGKGVAIGFDITYIGIKQYVKSQKVMYPNQNQEHKIFNKDAQTMFHDHNVDRLIDDSFFKKNPAFLEEEEFRIMYNHCNNDKSPLLFRKKGEFITSYIDIPIENFDISISNIILGPDCRLIKEDVEFILKMNGLKKCRCFLLGEDDEDCNGECKIIIENSLATYRNI